MIGLTLVFALGILIGSSCPVSFSGTTLWCTAAAATALALVVRRWPRLRRSLLFLAVFAFGILRVGTAPPFPAWLLRRADTMTEVTGTVVSYPDLGTRHITFTLAPDHLPARIRVTWFAGDGDLPAVAYGDRLRLTGDVSLSDAFDGFDYPAYLARRNVFATMRVASAAEGLVAGTAGFSIPRAGDLLRQRVLARLRAVLSPTQAALAQGLLLGDRTALGDELTAAFERTGMMHVLAVSGLHLGIVLAGAWFALRWIGLRPAWTFPLVGILVAAVLWIVGPRVSLIRASLLFAFLALGSVLADLGRVLRRTVRPINGLGFAALVILALHPNDLFDAGFQLSFGATVGILLAVHPAVVVACRRWAGSLGAATHLPPRLFSFILSILIVSAAAQAGAAPVVAWHFGTFHPWALLANLVVIPLVTLALWLGLAAVLLSGTPIGALAATPFGWAIEGFLWVIRGVDALPGVACPASRFLALWLAGASAFVLAVITIYRARIESAATLPLDGDYPCGSSSWTLYSTSMTSGSRREGP